MKKQNEDILIRILLANEIETSGKLKFVHWLLKQKNKENMVIMTYRKMAELSGFSYATVTAAIKALTEAGIMRKVNSGSYLINFEPKEAFNSQPYSKKDEKMIERLASIGLDEDQIVKQYGLDREIIRKVLGNG